MKLNWGTSIVIAFVAFISFIMYFIVNMSIDDKYDHDLVVQDYYQEELKFQNTIDKQERALSLNEHISWKKSANGLIISFPKNLNSKNIKGKVFLYRPSNKKLDFEVNITSLSDHNLLIPDNKLLGGRWNIIIDWTYNNNAPYQFKENIVY